MYRNAVLAALAEPNRAWLVLLVGIVMVYRELMAPGRILPGVLGAVGICVAIYSLFQHPWRPDALALIIVGVALLVLQGFRRLYWIPAIAAAALITIGAHRLTDPAIDLLPAAGAIPLSAITAFLLRTAILARQNKVSLE